MLDQKIKLYWRRTKIIATLGPASNDKKVIDKLIKSGVDVFRLNMSHGDHDQHRAVAKLIRKIANENNRYIAILMDLCGPKIRAGKFKDGEIKLKTNESVIISCNNIIGEKGIISSQYKKLYKDVISGDRILLDDGNLELTVKDVIGKEINCKVKYGGVLKDNKGINLPDSKVSISSFTSKDKKDVELAIELKSDFIALSFVREAKDIQTLKKFMWNKSADIPVIAKIEKPEAVNNIDSILKTSYGIMIARGDLGIELPAEKVPLIQNELINRARIFHRPVIVATQMMESMIVNSRPTRAEVGDVANAALASTDAVMLSAETASGKFPVKSVKIMDQVLREAEGFQWSKSQFGEKLYINKEIRLPSERKAISHAVSALSQDLDLQGIIIPTRSGTTAKVLAADRPTAPLIGVCSDKAICRRLALHWGVVPFNIEERVTNDWKKLCEDVVRRCKLMRKGRTVLLVSGFNDDSEKSEPVMKIVKV
jgi:pyruvate kinase